MSSLQTAISPPEPSVCPAALWLAAAVEVHTAKEVVAVNGTNQRLKCTFSSSSPVSDQLLVSWNFQPEDLGSHEPVSEIFVLRFRGSPLPQHPALGEQGVGMDTPKTHKYIWAFVTCSD